MDVFAGICFVISAATELGAVWLLVAQARMAKAELSGWELANPAQNPEGSMGQLMLLNPVVTRLLGDQARPRTTVALLVIGVVVGLIGNFASL